MLGVKFFIK